MTATQTSSTWKPPSHSHSNSRSSRPSTTPRTYSTSGSVAQTMPPNLSSQARSPPPSKISKSPDAGYFGFVVNDDSNSTDANPGQHMKQNWNYTGTSRAGATPRHQSIEANPEFEAFRRQSETTRFALSGNVTGLRKNSQTSATENHRRAEDSPVSPHFKKPYTAEHNGHRQSERNPFFDVPRHDSPVSITPAHSVAEHQHARLSLPASELQIPLEALKKKQRSETLPPAAPKEQPQMIAASEVARLLDVYGDKTLLLDIRVYPQYASSRIKGALSLCIPTMLLKRPAFTVQQLAETFSSDHDKNHFARWEKSKYIVVYDANSTLQKEATMPFNVLKKFENSGWEGHGIVVKGGFQAFAKSVPKLVDSGPVSQGNGASTQPLSISANTQGGIAVAGGCSMPATKNAANPFFSNIRQNMDLVDGVGQIPIKKPTDMSEKDEKAMPKWLRAAFKKSDEGRQVSDKFLNIERSEQKRMQQALSGQVVYGTSTREKTNQIQVAGIEKGSKNRYNNIFPFDHTRVKLQGIPQGGCDYVNASYIKSTYSNRKYIATQAPIPATFEDFWRVIWEQDIRVVVMLTAESEGGQVKSHVYWNSGEYGLLRLKKLNERQVSLERGSKSSKSSAPVRPTLGPRRSTQAVTAGEKKEVEEHNGPISSDHPSVTVRNFTLSHASHPFQPVREITQLQYTQWPDFGAPASPTAILGLIDQVNRYVRSSTNAIAGHEPDEFATEDQRPIVVHCSAGCGRTGTFCTIDSVIDMLKQQRFEKNNHDYHMMDIDVPDDWISRDDIDLVARTVEDFRKQRLSMVQNLRQFVLCYESVLGWAVAREHTATRSRQEGPRRSYQGSMVT